MRIRSEKTRRIVKIINTVSVNAEAVFAFITNIENKIFRTRFNFLKIVEREGVKQLFNLKCLDETMTANISFPLRQQVHINFNSELWFECKDSNRVVAGMGVVPRTYFLNRFGDTSVFMKLTFECSRNIIRVIPTIIIKTHKENKFELKEIMKNLFSKMSNRDLLLKTRLFQSGISTHKCPLIKEIDDVSAQYMNASDHMQTGTVQNNMADFCTEYGKEIHAGNIAKELFKITNSPMNRIFSSLTKDKTLDKLVKSGYPLESVSIIRRKKTLRDNRSNELEISSRSYTSSNGLDIADRSDTYVSPLLKLLEMRDANLILQFRLSDVTVRAISGGITFKNGILFGDFMLAVSIAPVGATISLKCHLKPLPSRSNSIVHYFESQGSCSFDQFGGDRNLHPHVSSGGEICMGDYTGLAENEILNGNFESVPMLVSNALEIINPSSVYEDLSKFVTKQKDIDHIIEYISSLRVNGLGRFIHEISASSDDRLDYLKSLHAELLEKEEKELSEYFAKECLKEGYKIVEEIPESIEIVEEQTEIEYPNQVDLLVNNLHTQATEIEINNE